MQRLDALDVSIWKFKPQAHIEDDGGPHAKFDRKAVKKQQSTAISKVHCVAKKFRHPLAGLEILLKGSNTLNGFFVVALGKHLYKGPPSIWALLLTPLNIVKGKTD